MNLASSPTHIVILTGAGISAESGLETFRDKGGIWDKYDLTEVATPEAYERNPEFVREFYNARKKQLLSQEVSPNPAHYDLTRLQKESKARVTIVTQNIDNLHERAGTQNVIHMHGELLKSRCLKSGDVFEMHEPVEAQTSCQCCGETETLRPHVVWFGEVPLSLDKIQDELSRCDLFVTIGTSGEVYPAAMFIDMVNSAGKAQTLEINLNATGASTRFQAVIQKKATEGVREMVDSILSLEGGTKV